MNLLDTNLPWHMQLVLLLDWASHTYVTAEFLAAVALAAGCLLCVWALERRRRRTRPASTLPGAPPPDGFLTLPAARRLADEAAAKRRAGDGEGALRLYMDVVRRGAGPATRSELFAGWLQAAAELSRESGCLMQALKLMQLQKFCYENAAVAGEAPAGAERRSGGGGGEEVGEVVAAEGSAEGGSDGDGCGAAALTLTQQRCHDFCRISRLFLSKQNSTMALDYAIKAYALRQKIDGKTATEAGDAPHGVSGLRSIQHALESSVATGEEHAVLLEAYAVCLRDRVGGG